MEEIFIKALATRSHTETDLLDKLPEDIKELVEDKLSEFNEAMLRADGYLPEDEIDI